MALGPTASQITVREVLAKLESDFEPVANAVENGEFALWVGSGISRQAPDLGDLIEKAINHLRVRAVDPATSADYLPALEEVLRLAEIDTIAADAPETLTVSLEVRIGPMTRSYEVLPRCYDYDFPK